MSGFTDTLNNIKITQTLIPAVISASAAPTAMDKKGAETTVHMVAVGALVNPDATDYYAIILQDSPDNSAWSVVNSTDEVIFKIGNTITTPETIASGIMKNLDASGDASKVYTVEYVGIQRYSKIVITEVTDSNDATAAIGVVSFNTSLENAGASSVIGTP